MQRGPAEHQRFRASEICVAKRAKRASKASPSPLVRSRGTVAEVSPEAASTVSRRPSATNPPRPKRRRAQKRFHRGSGTS